MFAGILSFASERPAVEIVGRADLLGALCRGEARDAAGSWSDGSLLVLQAKMCGANSDGTRWGSRSLPVRCVRTGRLIGFWGRLDNRDELERELDHKSDDAADEELVLAAFDRWGPDCAKRLEGDLAAAVVDPVRRVVWLVRDRLGVKPLYWRSMPEAVVFATSAAVLTRLRPAAEAVDRAWIARELTGTHDDEAATPWSDVRRLPPGHWVELSAESQRSPHRYHEWRDDPQWATKRDDEWVKRYRDHLEEAIRCRMRGTDLIAVESSGGIDSSTIVAYLARSLGEDRGRLFAIGFAGAELEGEYIAETSRHARVHRTCLLTRTLNRESIMPVLEAVGFPAEGTGAAFTPLYEECKLHGMRTLFSGFGGDESVTNSGSLLGRELLDRRAYGALYNFMRGKPPARAARVARALAIGERWGGGHPTLAHAMAARWPHQLVRKELVHELKLFERYQEQAGFDGPHRRINDFVLRNRLGPNISRRLEACTLIAASHGLDYRWPLLDARLVQQWLSTPSIEKASREFGRLLHRRAVHGVLAPKVGWKPTKDMGGVVAGPVPGRDSELEALSSDARTQRANIHPIVSEVIDIDRLDAQIAAARDGTFEREEQVALQFRRNVSHLRWLNRWLWGE